MQGQTNPKIVGATIIGFALVAGAYTISSLMSPKPPTQAASPAQAAPARVSIDVADEDNNGIEDWRDEFVTAKPVILDVASSSYTPPDTLTGQMSINFLEGILRSRGYGPFGSGQEEIIKNTIDVLRNETDIKLYDTPDISIMETWQPADIRNYANTVAATIYRHNVPGLEWEMEVMYDIMTTKDTSRMGEIETMANIYKNYRDDTLQIPVPAFLVKEHLDLINTYNALYEDITALTMVFDDPAISLLRLKRYQDDTTGLAYALENMYLAFEPFASLAQPDDPALLFVLFSPNLQVPN